MMNMAKAGNITETIKTQKKYKQKKSKKHVPTKKKRK